MLRFHLLTTVSHLRRSEGGFFFFFLYRSPVRETGKDTVINECERSPDKHDTEPSAPYLPADRRLPPLRHKA